MKTPRTASRAWALLLVGLVVPPMGGCSVMDALQLRRPSARMTGVGLKDISLDSLTLLFDVEVENPYSVPLPLVNLDYSLASEGTPFLSGRAADLPPSIPARSTKTLPLPAKITYLKLLQALQGVRPGAVVPYSAEIGLSVNASGLGEIRLPLKKEGKLPIPTAPEVKITEIKWDEMTLDRAGGRVKLSLTNRNQFAVKLAGLAYNLSLGGVQVAESSIARPATFDAAGGTGTVEIPISLSPRKLGLAAFGMLSGTGSGYKLTGAVDLETPFGPMKLPIEGAGSTIFRR